MLESLSELGLQLMNSNVHLGISLSRLPDLALLHGTDGLVQTIDELALLAEVPRYRLSYFQVAASRCIKCLSLCHQDKAPRVCHTSKPPAYLIHCKTLHAVLCETQS